VFQNKRFQTDKKKDRKEASAEPLKVDSKKTENTDNEKTKRFSRPGRQSLWRGKGGLLNDPTRIRVSKKSANKKRRIRSQSKRDEGDD